MKNRKTKKQRGGLSGFNINQTIKNLLGQYTFVSKKTVKPQTLRVLNTLNGNSSTPQNTQHSLRVNKLTGDLVSTCKKILLKKEADCQCFDKNNTPLHYSECKNNAKQCEAYNKCRKIFSSSLTGSEPHYNPDDWSDPLVEGTHNCYMYFLNDQQDRLKKKCITACKDNGKNNKSCKKKKQSSCSNLKPQPGNYAQEQGNFTGNRRIYSCPAMIDKVMKDNYKKGSKKSKIIHYNKLPIEQQFLKKCPENHYKGVLVVHPKKTYHFYRQDKNGRFSHKQGTLRVENIDAEKKPIYVPHLSKMNYSKGRKNGINYTDFCGYMCVPENTHESTYAK